MFYLQVVICISLRINNTATTYEKTNDDIQAAKCSLPGNHGGLHRRRQLHHPHKGVSKSRGVQLDVQSSQREGSHGKKACHETRRHGQIQKPPSPQAWRDRQQKGSGDNQTNLKDIEEFEKEIEKFIKEE